MEERNPGEYLVAALLFGIVFFQALKWLARGLKDSRTIGRYLSRGFYASHIRKTFNRLQWIISPGFGALVSTGAKRGLGIFKLQAYGSTLRGPISRFVSNLWQVITGALMEISLIGWLPDGYRFALLYHVHYG